MKRFIDELTKQEKRELADVLRQKRSGNLNKDWSEIVEEWELDISPDTLRRAAIGVELACEAGILDDSASSYMERQKLRDLTAQVNKAYRSEARSELLHETIKDAVSKLPLYAYCRYHGPARSGENSLVVAIGDIHYGADIYVEGLNGEILNRYNSEVFENRMEQLFGEIVDIARHQDVSDIQLCFVGDLLDGMLRQSQLMRLEYGIVESTMRVSEYLSSWIAELSSYVSSIQVHAVTGNHSEVRPLKSKHREFEEENLERIVMWYMAERLKHRDNIVVDPECKRLRKLDVCGYSFLLLHGDGDQSIENIARDSVNLYGKPIDYFICGHLHRDESKFSGVTNSGNSRIIRTPSICGMDKYAQSKGQGGRPGAVAMVVSSNMNHCCVYNLTLR